MDRWGSRVSVNYATTFQSNPLSTVTLADYIYIIAFGETTADYSSRAFKLRVFICFRVGRSVGRYPNGI